MNNKTKKSKIIDFIETGSVLILTTAVFYILFLNQFSLLSEYRQKCDASSSLSWDGNLRFMQSLDAWKDLHNGEIIKTMIFFLDSPTWPPLRSAISFALFLLNPSGPSPSAEPYAGFFFGILWIISAVWISIRLSGNILPGLLTGFSASALMLRSEGIAAYTMSSMLETQGIFFMLWSLYYLAANYSGKSVKYLHIKLFISAFGLFFTKYPYGIMLIIGIYIFEIFYYFENYKRGLIHAVRNHYYGARLMLIAGFAVLISALVITGKILPEYKMDLKILKNILWPAAFIIISDLLYYIYKFSKVLKDIYPEASVRSFKYIFVPQIIWLIIHPDRFMSIVDTQQHIQNDSESFFVNLLTDFFRPSWIIYYIIIINILLLIIYIYLRYDRRKRIGIGNDIIVLGSLVLIQLLIIEFLTGNKQTRHMYHLIPALLIFLLMALFRLVYYILEEWIKCSVRTDLRKNICIFLPGLLLLLISSFALFSSPPLYSKSFHKSHPVCFTGTDPEVFAPAKWAASGLFSGKRYIIINMFHTPYARGPYADLATEMDLAIRMKVYPHGDARNDSAYRYRNWEKFNSFIFLSHSCSDAAMLKFLEDRLGKALPPERIPPYEKWKTELYHGGELCRIVAEF